MSTSRLTLLAYGCVASAPRAAPFAERLKKAVYSVRDRCAFKLGKLDQLDFRNHDNSGTYNLGDHAIMMGCLQAIDEVRPDATAVPVNWMHLEEIHSDSEAVIICGSGYFFLDGQFRLPARISADLAFIEKHDLPLIIFGAGVNLTDATLRCRNPQIAPEQQLLLRSLLERCTHISVRDEASRQFLQSCTEQLVEVVGDPALFLQRTTVSARSHASQRPLIGLNLPFHGRSVNQQLVKSLPIWIDTFKEIQRQSGCHFYYMVHYDAEIVVAEMMRDAGVDLTIIQGGVDVLLSNYSRLNLHLVGMLHSCILAASTGTPSIGLAYDIKHVGFFDLLDLPDLCIPTDPWPSELIIQKTLWALSTESDLRMHIRQRRDFFRGKALAFLNNAVAALNHGA